MPLVAIDARDAGAPELRGWGRYTASLLRALQAHALDGFELAALTAGGFGPEVVFEQLGLPLQLRRRHADLVHAPNCFLPLVRPCPGVVTIHDLAFETWPSDFARTTLVKYRTFTRLSARSAQLIICPSDFTRRELRDRYGVAEDKVRVIGEAPALPIGDEPAPDGPYLLAVGDLRKKKNLGALVAAFVSLRRNPGIPHRLVLAGVDAGEGPRLLEQAAGEPVELTGYVSDARLDALIRGADVVVHPSLCEGFGLVVLESMARGTPVLIARAGALPETAGEAAASFDPLEPGSLRHELRRLLEDASLTSDLEARGRVWAERFSWERTARETAAVYRELL